MDIPDPDLPELDPPELDPKAPLDRKTIRETYLRYLGRGAHLDRVNALVDSRTPLGELEHGLLHSPEHWQKGPLLANRRRGRWDGAILVIRPARVLFCPIAKVANTSVKTWALRLSGHDIKGSVHEMLDSGTAPLQLRCQSEQVHDAMMRSPDWARVAILRDPVDRLVSAYWDKFVHNRRGAQTLQHTLPVYRFLLNSMEITPAQIEEGITFRQFCHYLNMTPRDRLDPHWAPQARYLESYRWDHLFRIEEIDRFERFILERCGPDVQGLRLGRQNAAPRQRVQTEENLSDLHPAQLDRLRNPPAQAMLTPDIAAFIRDYYAMDALLRENCRG